MTHSSAKRGTAGSTTSRIFAVGAVALGLLLHTAAARAAAPVCMPHDELRAQLHEKFSEVPTAIAVANNGALVHLFTKSDGSTWTLTLTRPRGLSCVLVAGEDWTELPWVGHDRLAEVPDRERTP